MDNHNLFALTLLVTLTVLAIGRGLVEAIFDSCKKRLKLVALTMVAMTVSVAVILSIGRVQAPNEGPLQVPINIVIFVAFLIAFIGGLLSSFALTGLILVNHKSLPGKG